MSCNLKFLYCSVFDILVNDPAVSAIIDDKVFNGVAPQDTLYPYCVFGGVNSDAFSTFDDDGDELIFSINLYDRSQNMANLYNLHNAIKEALSRQEEALCTDECPVFYIKYSGTFENPIKDMIREGRLLTIEFQIKTL